MPSLSMWDKLAATRVGNGERVVVLANGLGTSQHTWRFVVDALAPRAQIIRFDHAGMTPPTLDAFDPARHHTLHGFADDVIALLDETDMRDVLFVGHSVSGMIGAIAAAAAPELISRLVMINGSSCYRNDGSYYGGFTSDALDGILAAAEADFHAWAAGFAPLAVGPEGTQEGIAEFTGYLRRMRPDVGLSALRTIFLGDYRTVLPRVSTHVDILQSLQDIAVPWSAAEYLLQHLPHSTLRPLQARGHVPQLTAAPELIGVLHGVLDAWMGPAL